MVHVDFQVPKRHTRVRYLHAALEYDDVALLAAITKVEEDDTPSAKHCDFELCATHLLPKDHVDKNRLLLAKRTAGQISGVNSGTKAREGIGSTGVHFRYYTPEEFARLT